MNMSFQQEPSTNIKEEAQQTSNLMQMNCFHPGVYILYMLMCFLKHTHGIYIFSGELISAGIWKKQVISWEPPPNATPPQEIGTITHWLSLIRPYQGLIPWGGGIGGSPFIPMMIDSDDPTQMSGPATCFAEKYMVHSGSRLALMIFFHMKVYLESKGWNLNMDSKFRISSFRRLPCSGTMLVFFRG